MTPSPHKSPTAKRHFSIVLQLLPSVWNDVWLKTARSNTSLFRQVFPLAPDDKIQTLEEMEMPKIADVRLAQQILKDVRGHLIEFPLNFLAGTKLDPNVTGAQEIVSQNLFSHFLRCRREYARGGHRYLHIEPVQGRHSLPRRLFRAGVFFKCFFVIAPP